MYVHCSLLGITNTLALNISLFAITVIAIQNLFRYQPGEDKEEFPQGSNIDKCHMNGLVVHCTFATDKNV